jgi:CrcB protein
MRRPTAPADSMQTVWAHAAAVALGGAAGSLLRWRIGLWINPLALPFALGTLAVNCIGGLLIGFSLVAFERLPNDTLRLLLVTGGLGGLTTFSAFSAESLGLLVDGRPVLAVVHTLAHVLGALACAAAGWLAGRWLWA